MQVLRSGATGDAVLEVRRILAGLGLLANSEPLTVATYDAGTELAVRHFQQRRGISVDGIVGPETFAALHAAQWRLGNRLLSFHAASPLIGDDVTELQRQLLEMGYDLGRADGVLGTRTDRALRSFQRDYGLRADGICGAATLRALTQLRRRVVGGRPQLLRELAAVSAAGPRLAGKRIVIDPGHGGDDRGVTYADSCESDLAWDIARRLQERLTLLGVQSWMTRGPHNGQTDVARADFANEIAADLVLSVHVDGVGSPLANGIATYHYGAAESSSTIGERLADLVQRELVARTGLLDSHVHAKTWTILRLTRMPAIQVEAGYLTSPRDRSRLFDPAFRETVAEGLVVAVQRLYLPTADDPPTGAMRLPAGVG